MTPPLGDADRATAHDTLREILATLVRIERALTALPTTPAPDAPTVDLDGPHGDPILKARDPRNWSGQTQVGKHMSECPADYLDLLAERYDYFATKETDEKKARYNRLDAARARGWAARIRAGHSAAVQSAASTEGGWKDAAF